MDSYFPWRLLPQEDSNPCESPPAPVLWDWASYIDPLLRPPYGASIELVLGLESDLYSCEKEREESPYDDISLIWNKRFIILNETFFLYDESFGVQQCWVNLVKKYHSSPTSFILINGISRDFFQYMHKGDL